MVPSARVQARSSKTFSTNLRQTGFGTQEEVAPMTWFLRNAFLALVAFAALAIIVMMAVSAEAKDLKPSTNPADAVTGADAKLLVAPKAPRNAADRTRQIV